MFGTGVKNSAERSGTRTINRENSRRSDDYHSSTNPTHVMTTEEENKAIARRVPEDIATQGNIDLIDELTTDNPVEHGAFGEIRGRDAIKGMMTDMRSAIPDFSATVEDILAEDDRVAMRVTLRGTHDGGEIMGLEPTGRTFEIPNMVITRMEDGKIAERWQVADNLMLMEQLGAVDGPDE